MPQPSRHETPRSAAPGHRSGRTGPGIDPLRVAVCGLGRMGTLFAGALVAAGHEVSVWNRTPGREPAGARAAASAAEAASGVEAVVLMVLDGPAARAVLLGPDGIAAGAAPGTLVVNASTIGPQESVDLAARAERAGLRYLEAPVLGSVAAARSGTLTVLVGGAVEDARAADPVLDAWSQAGDRRHTGPVGTATGLKLVANLALGVAAAGLRDAVTLGRDLGLPRAQVLDLLADGMLGRFVEYKRPRLDADAYEDADFTLAALGKDLALARAAARGPLPMAEAAAGTVEQAVRDGDGERDFGVLGRPAGTGGRPEGRRAL
ncbi:NAD(P)-dependent oxidoreductase [Kitasatospora sp. NBC_00374]|uniref:NAD(P)-dependent oxidoreductase n=1 Tax=Kitasatospora sp. NBC_00374 TaxID=2975964 RepID=UPI00324DC203